MEKKDVIKLFNENLNGAGNSDKSPAVATVMTLLSLIEGETSLTFQEFHQKFKCAMEVLKSITTSAEVESVSEIFLRYISLKTNRFKRFKEAKEDLMNRGNFFLKNVSDSKRKVAEIAYQFITDGSTILVHSNSRVVFYTLSAAAKHGKAFKVLVTQSAPDNTGNQMCKWLIEEGIQSTLILDAEIGYHMERVHMVLVGAEAVVTNGGVINKIGTYPIAVCAREVNKPFYVLVESYKFSRLYPLKQENIPDCMKFKACSKNQEGGKWTVADYTDPKFVTLLITDLGPLATAAVSDVLMQLYL